MFSIVLFAICSFLHADWEYVTAWTGTITATGVRFGGKSGGNWDPGSDKAEPYVVVKIPSWGKVIDTSKACSNCNTNTWHGVSGGWSRSGITLAQVASVTVEMWDSDADGNDQMGGGTLNLADYRSLGTTRTIEFPISCSGCYVRLVLGLYPYTITACSSRYSSTASPYCYSNADSYLRQSACYQQLSPTGNGTYLTSCSTTCPTGISNSYTGRCVLKLYCYERQANTSYTYPCGTTNCYQQLNSYGDGPKTGIYSCDAACPTGISNANANGKCVLKTCSDRHANTSYVYACGTSTCYRQLNSYGDEYGTGAGSCDAACPTGISNTNADGKCVLKPDCNDRQANTSYVYACGTSTCYHLMDSEGHTYLSGADSCNTTCALPQVAESSIGKCVHDPNCHDRPSDTTLKYPCGDASCFQQLNHTGDGTYLSEGDVGSCDWTCPSGISDANTNGKCMLKANCSERQANESYTYPCGASNCYQQLNTDGDGTYLSGGVGSCDYTCPTGISKANPNGKCVLKPNCYDRQANTSFAYPCGSPTCYQQVDSKGKDVAGSDSTPAPSSCADSCPPVMSTPILSPTGTAVGKCTFIPCVSRIVDLGAKWPCGSSDCYHQVDSDGNYLTNETFDEIDSNRNNGTFDEIDSNGSNATFDENDSVQIKDGFDSAPPTCAASCRAIISAPGTDGKCTVLACELRTPDEREGVELPCGTSDCLLENKKCVAPKRPASKGGNKKTIIIVAVVASVVVLAIVLAIIILVVLRRKKRQANLLADWDCQSGSEIKSYSVRDNIGNSQNSKLYEFIKDGKIYTAKCVRAEDGGFTGDFNWAEDFSLRNNSKFLVKYYESIRGKNGEHYLVMEHFEQENLQALLDSLKKMSKDVTLTPDKIMKIVIQVLFGLEELHRQGIIHRDLCTETIFIDENDDAKIGGFGCAQKENIQSKDREMQSFDYVPSSNRSPEVRAGGNGTSYTDMWCLGLTCYKLCNYPQDIDYNDVRVRELKAPDALIEIIDSLLNQNPDERPSASTLLQHPFIREYAKQLNLVEFLPHSSTE